MVNLLNRIFYNFSIKFTPCIFIRSYNASSVHVLNSIIPTCKIIPMNCPNNFIKKMNIVNPQLTGYVVEKIYSSILDDDGFDPTLILDKINIYTRKYNIEQLYNIILDNIDEYVSFCHYLYENKFIDNFMCLQDNLSFKLINKCKIKNYKCFADIVCSDEIVDIKVVKSPLINKKGFTSVGIKYYNQLMTYACGFKRKYGFWPNQIKIINFYQNNILIWNPCENDFIKFERLL